MRRATRLWGWLTPVVLATCVTLAVLGRRGHDRYASGPLPHEAYVWQRQWTAAVREAVAEHGPQFQALVALAAEVSWDRGQARVTRVAWDPAAATPGRWGLALRVGPFAGPFAEDDRTARFLGDLAAALVSEARARGAAPAELQIDFDCATAKLDGYRTWVTVLRRRIAPVPLTITVLPSWIGAPGFRRLVRATDGFVLQVHSLERPAASDPSLFLCDPAAARRAVAAAAGAGVPFRVALPTYGYTVACRRDGTFAGLCAEGPAPAWPADAVLREVRADPVAMAELVRDWTVRRPAALTGIIWYRLPNRNDAMNWTWPTLATVMTGRAPAADVRSEPRRPEPGLAEVDLLNAGTGDAAVACRVVVSWAEGDLLAADALGGFERAEVGPHSLVLHSSSRGPGQRLRPGQRRTIAWLRFARDTEVQTHVAPIP